MTDKTRILFVNDEMHMGGVARVLNTLMQHLPRDRYDIDLLVLHKEGMLLDEIPSDVNIYEGSAFFRTVDMPLKELVSSHDWMGVCSKLRLLFYMKTGLIKNKIVEERKRLFSETYDVEVAAKEGFCTIFTAYGDSRKKINWVLTDYSVCNYSKNHMRLVRQALSKIDMNIADSQQAQVAYQTVFRVTNGMTIHNLMDTTKVEAGMQESVEMKDGLKVICVARFHPQKGIDRLITASKYALDQGIEHTLYLIGGGELEEQLRSQVQALGMNNVVFMGYQSHPYGYVRASDLFVLSSYYEGFATIVNESLIATTPVLMTDVSGAKDQITDANYGWVVENKQDALNEGLVQALSDPKRLAEMKETLKSYRYPNEEILEQFMQVLR